MILHGLDVIVGMLIGSLVTSLLWTLFINWDNPDRNQVR